MLKGTLIQINRDRGFGFIAADDGGEFFVHKNALPADLELAEAIGSTFEFTLQANGDQRSRAVNLRLIEERQWLPGKVHVNRLTPDGKGYFYILPLGARGRDTAIFCNGGMLSDIEDVKWLQVGSNAEYVLNPKPKIAGRPSAVAVRLV
ncbi:cold-shock protein [Bradyrhizobium sp. USDA 4508]